MTDSEYDGDQDSCKEHAFLPSDVSNDVQAPERNVRMAYGTVAK